MRLASILLALSGVTATTTDWEFAPANTVLERITSEKLILVAFVAPWTTPSTALLPEWSAGIGPISVPHMTVDCNNSPSTCASLDVHSYPTIRMYHGSDKLYTRYRGPRTAEGINSFVVRMTMPPLSTVTAHNISELQVLGDVVYVAHIKDSDGANKKQIRKLAKAMHVDYIFAISTDDRTAKDNNVKVPALVAYKNTEDDATSLPLPADQPTLEKFIKQASQPMIGEFTRRSEMGYLSSPKILAYMFISNSAERTALRKSFHKLAKQYAQYVSFVTIDSQEYAHVAAKLGVEMDILPAFTLYSAWKDQVFRYAKRGLDEKTGIESKGVEEFLLEVLHGKRQPEGASGERGHDEL